MRGGEEEEEEKEEEVQRGQKFLHWSFPPEVMAWTRPPFGRIVKLVLREGGESESEAKLLLVLLLLSVESLMTSEVDWVKPLPSEQTTTIRSMGVGEVELLVVQEGQIEDMYRVQPTTGGWELEEEEEEEEEEERRLTNFPVFLSRTNTQPPDGINTTLADSVLINRGKELSPDFLLWGRRGAFRMVVWEVETEEGGFGEVML